MPDLSALANMISPRPVARLSRGLKSKLDAPNLLIDVHTHLFNVDDVPRDYLGLRFDIPSEVIHTAQAILDSIPIVDSFVPPMVRRLLDNLTSTPHGLLSKVENAYEGFQHIFVVLMMDMRGIGQLNRHTYQQQIDALEALMILKPDILLPFLALDPTQDDFLEYFERVFAVPERSFHGLKLYPSLGYLPSHPNLMKIFGICEDKGIPVTTHCSSAMVNLRKRKLEVQGLDRWGKTIHREVNLPSRDSYKHFFNNPSKWIPVFKAFPKLKVNIAHYGGAKAWEEYRKGKMGKRDGKWIHTIHALLHEFEGAYADFSYTMYDRKATARLIEDIQHGIIPEDKILYGSDFFLIENEDALISLFQNFRRQIGPSLFRKMSQDNPKAFLF